MAPCTACGAEYKGFGSTCGPCRGNRSASVEFRQCGDCHAFFGGSEPTCADCTAKKAKGTGAATAHRRGSPAQDGKSAKVDKRAAPAASADRRDSVSPDGLVVPVELVEAIASGNCIAFVGAGFSAAANLPGWGGLLRAMINKGVATGKVDSKMKKQLEDMVNKGTGSSFECCAQMLEDLLDNKLVADTCAEELSHVRVETVPHVMMQRIKYLYGIPFHAILTTNFDGILDGPPAAHPDGKKAMREILRRTPLTLSQQILRGLVLGTGILAAVDETVEQQFKQFAMDEQDADEAEPNSDAFTEEKMEFLLPTIIQLHGTVTEEYRYDPGLAFTREGYRRLLHGDVAYRRFLSTAMTTKTVLYMGFSFSDEYINELRSSTMHMLGGGEDRPIGYAIACNMQPAEIEFFERHEGLKILNYIPENGPGFEGLEKWLEAIHNQTNPLFRWGKIFKQKRVLCTGKNWLGLIAQLTIKLAELQFGKKGDVIVVPDLPNCKDDDEAEGAKAFFKKTLAHNMPLHLVLASFRSGAAKTILRVMNENCELRAPVLVLDTSLDEHEVNKSKAFLWGATGYVHTAEEWLEQSMHVLSPAGPSEAPCVLQ